MFESPGLLVSTIFFLLQVVPALPGNLLPQKFYHEWRIFISGIMLNGIFNEVLQCNGIYLSMTVCFSNIHFAPATLFSNGFFASQYITVQTLLLQVDRHHFVIAGSSIYSDKLCSSYQGSRFYYRLIKPDQAAQWSERVKQEMWIQVRASGCLHITNAFSFQASVFCFEQQQFFFLPDTVTI